MNYSSFSFVIIVSLLTILSLMIFIGIKLFSLIKRIWQGLK